MQHVSIISSLISSLNYEFSAETIPNRFELSHVFVGHVSDSWLLSCCNASIQNFLNFDMNQTSSFWNHILYLIINLRLATETSLAVLSTLLLDWLEHLKVPLIDKVFLHIIHIFHVSNDTYITLFGPPQFPSKRQGFPTQLYSCNYKFRYWYINNC